MQTATYFIMPSSDGGNPLLIKNYRYQPQPEQEDANANNPRSETRHSTSKNKSMNESYEATPKYRKPVLPLKLSTPKTQEFGMLGTLFRASQERAKLKFMVPSHKRAYTPGLRTSTNLNSMFQTPTQNNFSRGKNPQLWSSSDNPYRHKVFKPVTPWRHDPPVAIPMQPNYQKQKITEEIPKTDTLSSLPHSIENSNTLFNSKKVYKLPQRIIPNTEAMQPQSKSKAPPTSYLLNRSVDLKSTQQKQKLQRKIRTGDPSNEFDNQIEKALRLSQKNLKKFVVINQSMDASIKSRRKVQRRRSQLGALLDLSKKLHQNSDEKRLRSASSNRSKSSGRSLSQTNGFYNYDSEERHLGSCKDSKTALKQYSLDEIDPPSDDELSFLGTVKKFYERKLHNPQKAKSYLNESTALKNELHSMINSESGKFKQKLLNEPQGRKPIIILSIEKQPEELKYLATYGASLL